MSIVPADHPLAEVISQDLGLLAALDGPAIVALSLTWPMNDARREDLLHRALSVDTGHLVELMEVLDLVEDLAHDPITLQLVREASAGRLGQAHLMGAYNAARDALAAAYAYPLLSREQYRILRYPWQPVALRTTLQT